MKWFNFLICVYAGMFVGYSSFMITKIVRKVLAERKKIKEGTPIEVNEDRLCTEPHSWMSARHISNDGVLSNINICSNCGFIPMNNSMLTLDGLFSMNILQAEKAKNKKILSQFIESEESTLKRLFEEEIKNGLDFSKVNQAYSLGTTLQDRYLEFKEERENSNE
jgi:hypothetical protein